MLKKYWSISLVDAISIINHNPQISTKKSKTLGSAQDFRVSTQTTNKVIKSYTHQGVDLDGFHHIINRGVARNNIYRWMLPHEIKIYLDIIVYYIQKASYEKTPYRYTDI
jgi:hypothetical protein